MNRLGSKSHKLEYSDFYEDFARFVLEQSFAEEDLEYYDVSPTGDGELLVVLRAHGKTKKYTVHAFNIVDADSVQHVLDELVELREHKARQLAYKLTRHTL